MQPPTNHSKLRLTGDSINEKRNSNRVLGWEEVERVLKKLVGKEQLHSDLETVKSRLLSIARGDVPTHVIATLTKSRVQPASHSNEEAETRSIRGWNTWRMKELMVCT